MKKSTLYMGTIVLLGLVLSGCEKKEQTSMPSEQKTDSYSIPTSNQRSQQNSTEYSFNDNGSIEVPTGNLSEDDPIFNSDEENTVIGEVLTEAENSQASALVTVKIDGRMQEFYISEAAVKLERGQVIKIKTNGVILETYPATFAEIFSIEVIR